MPDRASAVPVAFDALRPIATVGAAFYSGFALLVFWTFRGEVTVVVPIVVGVFALALVGVRMALATRFAPTLRRHALVVVAILALACASIPLMFMAVWQRPYPGIGLALITVGIAALIHHHGLAIALVAWCNGGWVWAAVTYGVPVPWAVFAVELSMVNVAAAILHMAGTRTVRRLEDAQREIAALAGTDELTGVANSRRVYDEGGRRMARLAEGDNLVAIYLDMDDLKARNDALGHIAGDQALRALARTLAAAVRPTDLVGRIGGDEFVILAENLDASAAQALCERIAADLAHQGLPSSVGFATAPRDATDFPTLVDQADRRMYSVKLSRASRRVR